MQKKIILNLPNQSHHVGPMMLFQFASHDPRSHSRSPCSTITMLYWISDMNGGRPATPSLPPTTASRPGVCGCCCSRFWYCTLMCMFLWFCSDSIVVWLPRMYRVCTMVNDTISSANKKAITVITTHWISNVLTTSMLLSSVVHVPLLQSSSLREWFVMAFSVLFPGVQSGPCPPWLPSALTSNGIMLPTHHTALKLPYKINR